MLRRSHTKEVAGFRYRHDPLCSRVCAVQVPVGGRPPCRQFSILGRCVGWAHTPCARYEPIFS
jgi:hypothetical protein